MFLDAYDMLSCEHARVWGWMLCLMQSMLLSMLVLLIGTLVWSPDIMHLLDYEVWLHRA
jgi:hypothetical protein